MANAIYPKYKDALLTGNSNVSLTSGTIKVSLIDKGAANVYNYDATNEFYSNVNANSVISTVTIANTSVANAIFNADDVVFTSVPAGDPIESLLIWIDTSNTETSRLVAWLDDGITGLPITPSGGNISVTWNASGIFKL